MSKALIVRANSGPSVAELHQLLGIFLQEKNETSALLMDTLQTLVEVHSGIAAADDEATVIKAKIAVLSPVLACLTNLAAWATSADFDVKQPFGKILADASPGSPLPPLPRGREFTTEDAKRLILDDVMPKPKSLEPIIEEPLEEEKEYVSTQTAPKHSKHASRSKPNPPEKKSAGRERSKSPTSKASRHSSTVEPSYAAISKAAHDHTPHKETEASSNSKGGRRRSAGDAAGSSKPRRNTPPAPLSIRESDVHGAPRKNDAAAALRTEKEVDTAPSINSSAADLLMQEFVKSMADTTVAAPSKPHVENTGTPLSASKRTIEAHDNPHADASLPLVPPQLGAPRGDVTPEVKHLAAKAKEQDEKARRMLLEMKQSLLASMDDNVPLAPLPETPKRLVSVDPGSERASLRGSEKDAENFVVAKPRRSTGKLEDLSQPIASTSVLTLVETTSKSNAESLQNAKDLQDLLASMLAEENTLLEHHDTHSKPSEPEPQPQRPRVSSEVSVRSHRIPNGVPVDAHSSVSADKSEYVQRIWDATDRHHQPSDTAEHNPRDTASKTSRSRSRSTKTSSGLGGAPPPPPGMSPRNSTAAGIGSLSVHIDESAQVITEHSQPKKTTPSPSHDKKVSSSKRGDSEVIDGSAILANKVQDLSAALATMFDVNVSTSKTVSPPQASSKPAQGREVRSPSPPRPTNPPLYAVVIPTPPPMPDSGLNNRQRTSPHATSSHSGVAAAVEGGALQHPAAIESRFITSIKPRQRENEAHQSSQSKSQATSAFSHTEAALLAAGTSHRINTGFTPPHTSLGPDSHPSQKQQQQHLTDLLNVSVAALFAPGEPHASPPSSPPLTATAKKILEDDDDETLEALEAQRKTLLQQRRSSAPSASAHVAPSQQQQQQHHVDAGSGRRIHRTSGSAVPKNLQVQAFSHLQR